MKKRRYTLGEIKRDYPKSFTELARMDSGQRNILLFLLSGMTTSPPNRGYADIEVDKEDAIISKLKVDYYVDITTKRAVGNYSYHMMTTMQIEEFFNDRESMRKRVSQKVWSWRSMVLDKAIERGIGWRGCDWMQNRCKYLNKQKELKQ